MIRSIEKIEAEYGQTVVAVVFNTDGTIHDHCFSWETGQNFALNGHLVQAVADDGEYMTKDAQQRLYDAEKERYDDCFGRP